MSLKGDWVPIVRDPSLALRMTVLYMGDIGREAGEIRTGESPLLPSQSIKRYIVIPNEVRDLIVL